MCLHHVIVHGVPFPFYLLLTSFGWGAELLRHSHRTHATVKVHLVVPEGGHLRSSMPNPETILEGKRVIPGEHYHGLSIQGTVLQRNNESPTIFDQRARSSRNHFSHKCYLYRSTRPALPQENKKGAQLP